MATVKLIILPRNNPVLSAFDVNEADSCFRAECPCPTAVGLRTACPSLSVRQGWQIARSYVSKPAFPVRRCDRTAPGRLLPLGRVSHCALNGSIKSDLTTVLVAMFICRVTQGVEYRPTHPSIYGVQRPSKFALHKVHRVLLDGDGESVGCRRCSGIRDGGVVRSFVYSAGASRVLGMAADRTGSAELTRQMWRIPSSSGVAAVRGPWHTLFSAWLRISGLIRPLLGT
jgi:hypothetical protein